MAATINRFDSLRFPAELGTDLVPHYITFVPQQVEYGGTFSNNKISRNSSRRAVNNNFNTTTPSNNGLADTIANKVNEAFERNGNNVVASLTDATLINFFRQNRDAVLLGEDAVNQGFRTLPDTVYTQGSINLFLPEGLKTTSGVDYSAETVGAVVNQLGTDDNITESVGDKTKINESLGGFGAGILNDIMKSIGKPAAVTALRRGEVANNFSFQLFNGVGHREFTYAFKMVPKDEKESQVIKKICDTFLYYMLPSRTPQSAGNIPFYQVPCQWDIKYYKMANQLEFHQQPKKCFLKNVDVEYGGDTGNNLYSDGSPMQVTLNLSFVEIEPLYRSGGITIDDASDRDE